MKSTAFDDKNRLMRESPDRAPDNCSVNVKPVGSPASGAQNRLLRGNVEVVW